MTIEEFISYDFHDSVINSLEVNPDGNVILSMDFCQWRQKDYKEHTPEVVNRTMVFVKATIIADQELLIKLSAGGDASVLSAKGHHNTIEFMVEASTYPSSSSGFYKIEIYNPNNIIFNP